VGVLTQDIKTEYNQNLQTLKQIDQYVMQGQQYAQMLTSAESLGTNISPFSNNLQPISDPSSLIQAKCSSGSGGGIVGSMMNSMTSLLSQNMDQSQQQICAQIVTTQVDKYNQTVQMLNTLNSYSTSLQKLSTMANSISNMGTSSSTTTQATTYSSQLTTQMSNWQAQMNADDAIIKTMEDQQKILSHIALNGGNTSILGDALPDTAFQSALGGVVP
jgi:hypothetical protein